MQAVGAGRDHFRHINSQKEVKLQLLVGVCVTVHREIGDTDSGKHLIVDQKLNCSATWPPLRTAYTASAMISGLRARATSSSRWPMFDDRRGGDSRSRPQRVHRDAVGLQLGGQTDCGQAHSVVGDGVAQVCADPALREVERHRRLAPNAQAGRRRTRQWSADN